jgi:hypothetical protein
MIGVTRVKPGVQFSTILPAGFRLLSAIDQAASSLSVDLTITSGTDGEHSGQTDPHHRGEAYDVRSQGFSPELKAAILDGVMRRVGWDSFYGFLESPNTPNEHFHFQVKKGIVWPHS